MATIYGTNFSEYIDGTNNSDVIFGYGGDDVIFGYSGNDDIYGGAGNDVIYGDAGQDNLFGGNGINDLWGGGGADWFIMSARAGAASDDWIGDFQFDIDRIDVSAWGISDFSQIKALINTDDTGSAWFNAFYNGYNHFLTIDWVAAPDLIASDFIYSDSGATNQTGTAYADTMFGSRYNDVLNGAAGNDSLLGGNGSDVLSGNGGNDRLIGGAGNDDLRGGAGRDVLTGGQGYDAFIFASAAESPANANRDSIRDFQPDIDLINLAAIDARPDLPGNQAFIWIGDADFSTPGQLRYAYAGGNTIVSGNLDSDQLAEFQIVLTGHFTLIAGDFVL